MTQTLLFTGNGGAGIALAAAATAVTAAQTGRRTLLASIGPSHSLPTLIGVAPSQAPQSVGLNLDAWALDAITDINAFWEDARKRYPNLPRPQVSGDELPLFPGIDLFLAVARLREQMQQGYDLVVVDVGQHDGLLRALSVPDSFRWGLRIAFGLDREPGRSMASVSRALIPTTFMPFEWLNQGQQARVQFEQLRDQTIDPRTTQVRYILRPDRAALADALVAVPALHLHGLAVDAFVVGPLLASSVSGDGLAELVAQQEATIASAAEVWPHLPVLRLPLGTTPKDVATLETLGSTIYAERSPVDGYSTAPPIQHGPDAAPSITVALPGIQRNALGLTLSGDELIVRVGPYRRHILLPDNLRGTTNIKATREGDTLVVRPRDASSTTA